MKRHKTRIIAILIFTAMSLSLLTSCSKAGGTTPSGAENTQTQAGQQSETPATGSATTPQATEEPTKEHETNTQPTGTEQHPEQTTAQQSGTEAQPATSKQPTEEPSTEPVPPFEPVIPDDITVYNDLRRPISPEQPMWLVHIDTWNHADPQKIIDLIPEDIRPFVVFNISLSISWDHDTDEWLMTHNGYETAKSWLRTCADNQVWAMIQPASGGQCHFPDYDDETDYEDTLYAEFYRDYPNFIGFNYCEQFWGFESEDFPTTPEQRYEHFARLLELSNKYGGYLVVSWCGNQWSPKINPLAMTKRIPVFEEACRKYWPNYILCEKYTQTSYLFDMESLVFGTYLSGYCGNFGVRYDESGWTDSDGSENHDEYRLSTSLAVELERFALNGMTVIDGPELIWVSDFHEIQQDTDADGYLVRKWEKTAEFENVSIDLFRKVLDGTIRIPTREEVIERTKVIIIQDVTDGKDDAKYSAPTTLYQGLYRMNNDGNLKDNHSFYKRTGRYPTIPIAYGLRDVTSSAFERKISATDLQPQWPPSDRGWRDVDAKVEYFNELFPEEYSGDIYAGRYENTWVAYNPYKKDKIAEGIIDCKYNTCEGIGLTLPRYTSALINEYADHIDFYINNYDEKSSDLTENIIKIYGCSTEPTYTYKDGGNEKYRCNITSEWNDNIFTLTIRQNGPVELTVSCSGTATGRLENYTQSVIREPAAPAFYTGPRQYEAEFFDVKNVQELVRNGCRSGVTSFQGQGYLKFGTSPSAAAKDTVTTKKSGTYTLNLRYSAPTDIDALALYVNGSKVCTLHLAATGDYSSWGICTQQITLNTGANKVEFIAEAELESALYIDNFVVEGDFGQ